MSGPMKKKSKKSKKTVKKVSIKKSAPRGKEKAAGEVLKDISKMVKAHSNKMAGAVIGEGEKGQLATVKYLWEVAGIYPPTTDGSESTEHEESLAQTLLRRLNVPETPVVADQYDEDTIVIPAQVAKVQQATEDPEEEIENAKAEESTEAAELISVE
jgi:hypothetical protein